MDCPHCKAVNPFFESLTKVEISPCIQNWKVLSYKLEERSLIFVCCECEKRVKIDTLHRQITIVDSDPIFDEVVTKILTLAKSEERKNEVIPQTVVDALKQRRFVGINHLLTGRELVAKIIEQKP